MRVLEAGVVRTGVGLPSLLCGLCRAGGYWGNVLQHRVTTHLHQPRDNDTVVTPIPEWQLQQGPQPLVILEVSLGVKIGSHNSHEMLLF